MVYGKELCWGMRLGSRSGLPAPVTELLLPLMSDSPTSPDDYSKIDDRVIRLWHLSNTITVGVLLLILLALVIFLGNARPGLLIAWCVVLPIALALAYWFAYKLCRSWRYRIDSAVLETHRGVIFHTTQLVPLARLQHVDIHQGPFERSFGLATLVLHTAGGQQAAVYIPGLDADHAIVLRDYLVDLGVTDE
jgi:membrane protein YdbS with pleckstrin-like domain